MSRFVTFGVLRVLKKTGFETVMQLIVCFSTHLLTFKFGTLYILGKSESYSQVRQLKKAIHCFQWNIGVPIPTFVLEMIKFVVQTDLKFAIFLTQLLCGLPENLYSPGSYCCPSMPKWACSEEEIFQVLEFTGEEMKY